MNQICKNLHNYEVNIVCSYDIRKTNNLYILETNIEDLIDKSGDDLKKEICRLKKNIKKIENKEYIEKKKKIIFYNNKKKKIF